MDLFINKLDIGKFESTNEIWNRLGLNLPENVGKVSELILEIDFKNKEEWEEYYYKHGRSKEYLTNVGKDLYDAVKTILDITLEECIECVRFRVICQTWNGIIKREPNTINQLELIYDGKFIFKKTNFEIDYNYAVDYEMFYHDKLICGIQIKPTTYETSNAPAVARARYCNKGKNYEYMVKFSAPVITLTSETNGIITSYKEKLKLDKFDRELP
jgi:ferredoxin-like protein FixX